MKSNKSPGIFFQSSAEDIRSLIPFTSKLTQVLIQTLPIQKFH